MFWSDPNLYGVTHPLREIPTPLTMGPPIPRFLPQPYGFVPPYFTAQGFFPTPLQTPMGFNPYLRQEAFTPFVRPETLAPQFQPPYGQPPYGQPAYGMNPYLQPFNMNVPPYNWIRPFGF